jgi:hypothetical protein
LPEVMNIEQSIQLVSFAMLLSLIVCGGIIIVIQSIA